MLQCEAQGPRFNYLGAERYARRLGRWPQDHNRALDARLAFGSVCGVVMLDDSVDEPGIVRVRAHFERSNPTLSEVVGENHTPVGSFSYTGEDNHGYLLANLP